MNKALIFDIKKCAVNDGQGIRTTVFFKGCPLSCGWCHNPESRSFKPQLIYYSDTCISCGICANLCHVNAIKLNKDTGIFINFDDCDLCGKCAEYCPANSLEIAGKEYTVKELTDIILEDFLFYDESGGGVTFSGGEPFAQMDFLLNILKVCKSYKLNTAIDTTGYTSKRNLMAVMPYTDIFLYDIKHIDENIHRELCGVSNKKILENLKFLSEKGAKISIRIPIIPNVNDGENLEKTAEFIKELKGIISVDLLPYHNIMKGKYERLGMNFIYEDLVSPDEREMLKIKNYFENNNFKVTIGG